MDVKLIDLMKRYIHIVLLFVSMSSAFAETEVNLGGRAGMNIAHIRKMEVQNTAKRSVNLGSNFGGILRVNFNKNIGVQTEILFTQKGQRWKVQKDSAKYFTRFVNNYIEVPVLAVARFGSDKVKFIGMTGVYMAYWSGAYTQSSTKIEKQTYKEDTEDYLFSKQDRRFDMGISTGIGVDFKLGKGWFELLARHNLGLISREKNSSNKTYNCNFNFSIGYLFNLTKHE